MPTRRKVTDMKRLGLAILLIVSFACLAWAGPATNPQTPIYQDTAVSPAFTTNQLAVYHSAARLVKAAPATTPKQRYSIVLKNIGTTSIYVGSTSAVTSSTGMKLAASEALTLDRSYSAVYAICGGSDNGTIAYLEEAK